MNCGFTAGAVVCSNSPSPNCTVQTHTGLHTYDEVDLLLSMQRTDNNSTPSWPWFESFMGALVLPSPPGFFTMLFITLSGVSSQPTANESGFWLHNMATVPSGRSARYGCQLPPRGPLRVLNHPSRGPACFILSPQPHRRGWRITIRDLTWQRLLILCHMLVDPMVKLILCIQPTLASS